MVRAKDLANGYYPVMRRHCASRRAWWLGISIALCGAAQGARSPDEYLSYAALKGHKDQQPLQQSDRNRTAVTEDSEELSTMGWGNIIGWGK